MLSYTGFVLPIDDVKSSEIIRSLTLKPPFNPFQTYMSSTQLLKFYRKSLTQLHIPKHWARHHLCELYKKAKYVYKHDRLTEFSLVWNPEIVLREEQENVVNLYKQSAENNRDGIISMYCGFGKTICACKIIDELKPCKTLIIVDSEELGNQWMDRIRVCFGLDFKIGWIQQSKCEIGDEFPIVLGMLQTLSIRTFDVANTLAKFEMIIVDECHIIGSEVYTNCLMKISARYMLGLSATPRRKDGMDDIMKWYLGDILIHKQRTPDKNTEVFIYPIKAEPEADAELIYDVNGNVSNTAMVSKIASNEYRNRKICEIISKILEENPKRKILVLSQRRELQLDLLYKMLQEYNIRDDEISYYVGRKQTKKTAHKAEIDKSQKSETRVVLGTYTKAQKGLDIPTLNTLVFATPVIDIEQSVGRIMRLETTEIHPMIIDFNDENYSNFVKQLKKRKVFYKEQKYTVH